MAHNPFDSIDARLSNIEDILLTLKNTPKEQDLVVPSPSFKFLPIQEIFKRKICSKPTFYEHLKKGEFTLYKFGSKSFVDSDEFLKAFHKVNLNKPNKK